MKKVICFSLILIILAIYLCACDYSETVIDDIDSSFDESINNDNFSEENLREKLIAEIEEPYLQEREKVYEGLTTVDKCELIEKYTEQWKQVADRYFKDMIENDVIIQPSEVYYSSDDFHKALSDMKNDWEDYYKSEISNYIVVIGSIYNSGTICGPLLFEYEYKMQKEWALKLVEIYQQLNIE